MTAVPKHSPLSPRGKDMRDWPPCPAHRLAYRAAGPPGSGPGPRRSRSRLPSSARGDRGRRDAGERLAALGVELAGPRRPLVWFHASSVGEGLQAESVLLELRRCVPQAQYVYTHFSPSAASAGAPAPGRRGRLSALRSSRAVGPLAGRARARISWSSPSSTSGPSWRRARDAAARGGHRRRDGEPGERPAALARADASRARVRGGDGGRRASRPRTLRRLARLGRTGGADPCSGRSAVRQRRRANGCAWSAGRSPAALRTRRADPGGGLHLARRRGGAPRAPSRGCGPARPDARLILVPHEPTRGATWAPWRPWRPVWASRSPVRLSVADGPAPLLVVDRVGVLATMYGAGTHGLCRRWVRSSRTALGAGAGGVGPSGGVRSALAGEPGRGPACSRRVPRASSPHGRTRRAGARAGEAVERLDRATTPQASIRDSEARRGGGAADSAPRSGRAEMLAELISSRPLRTSPTGAR